MPLPININDLLRGKPVEWERLEFKAGWNPEEVLHTLCAFANDIHNLGGGYIIIGIEEKNGHPVLPPVGLDVAQIDSIQKELLNLGYSAIAPYYHPITVPVELEGRQVLVLWALGGPTARTRPIVPWPRIPRSMPITSARVPALSVPEGPTKPNSCPWPRPSRSMTGSINRPRSKTFLVI